MITRIFITLCILFALTGNSGATTVPKSSGTNEAINEGIRQYNAVVEFNRANKAAGRSDQNLYIFGFDPAVNFLEQWVAHKSMDQNQEREFRNSFLLALNAYLNEYNTNPASTQEIYVCLVSNYKVKLNKEISENINTQEGVVASLKSAYESSKSAQDQQSLQNYENYLNAYKIEINKIIDGIFTQKKANHIIASSVSYFQFDLESDNKIATYRRASRFLRIADAQIKTNLVNYLNSHISDTTHLLSSQTPSERALEQKIIWIRAYLQRGSTPVSPPEGTIDIERLNQQTAQRREQNWTTDITNLATKVNSALASGNTYVINPEVATSIGYESYLSVFQDKFEYLKKITGTHFIVAFAAVEYTIPDFKKNEFAQTVLNQVTAAGKSNAVVVTIPVYTFVDLAGKSNSVTSAGYASNPAAIVDADFEYSNRSLEFILNAYKRVPKPHHQYVYKINANQSITYNKISQTQNVRGFGAIEEIIILKSTYLQAIEDLDFPTCTNRFCDIDRNYRERVQQYFNERKRLLFEGALNETQNPGSSYTLINHGNKLKESKLSQLHDSYFYYSTKSGLGQWFHDFGTVITVTTITAEDYYNFDALVILDPLIYGAIDIAGLIPIVDNFADGAGLLYAAARKDIGQIQNYTIALAMVGGGAILVKGAKKLYSVVAKRNADNTVQLIAKEINNIDEVPATDLMTIIPSSSSADEVTAALKNNEVNLTLGDIPVNDLPPIQWSDQVREAFEAAGLARSPAIYEFRKLLARSDLSDEVFTGMLEFLKKAKPDNFSALASKIDNLGDDAPQLFKDLSGDLGRNLDWDKFDDKLVDAWESLSKSGSLKRTSATTLESLQALIKDNKFGWDAQKFQQTFTKMLRDVREGTVIKHIDDEGVEIESVVGKTIQEDEFLNIFQNLNSRNIPKSADVLSELCCESSWKYVGAEMVLRSASNKNLWDNIETFEKYVSEINGGRYIDILLKDGKRIEVKSWNKLYASFITQFVKKDLTNAVSLDKVEWIFDAKYPGNLKDDITAMLKANKSAIESIPTAKKIAYFPGYDELVGITDTQIEKFMNDNYDKIITLQ